MNPKKTRLVLNVGVTGHRDITPTEEQCLLELSKEVLNLVSNFVKKVYKEELELYTNEEPKLRLITSLAEGFDRIAAQAALALGYEIQCPLPFSRNDYCEDFQSQESKEEFLSLLHKATSIYELDFGRSIIDKQYLNAGIVMLEHADILLAFWDGAPAKGPGGTMEIVELAKEKGIPTIHINRDMLVTCGKDYIWQDVIRKEIRALLLPYDDISNNNSFPYIYFSENLERKSHASLYNNIIKLFSPKAKKKNNSIKKESFNSSNGNLKTKEKLYFDSFYNEADYLAMYYADYYRSAGALRSLIPLSANIALAVGFYWRWGENANIVNVLGFLLQVLLLYWMIRIVGDKTEKNKWHQKFIDYRILAESIKNQSYASAFGITLREIQISAYNTNDSISWINWYLRNINAEIGLPNITLNKKAIEHLLSDFNTELIIDQMHYHHKNSCKISAVGKKLERIGVIFFTAGAIVTIIRVIVHYACQIDPYLIWLPNPEHKVIKLPTFINMLSLLLPAFGTVMFSLAAQLGFDKLALRHNYMRNHLANISDEIQEIKDEAFLTVRKKTLIIVKFLIDEVTDWRMFIKSKGISKR